MKNEEWCVETQCLRLIMVRKDAMLASNYGRKDAMLASIYGT